MVRLLLFTNIVVEPCLVKVRTLKCDARVGNQACVYPNPKSLSGWPTNSHFIRYRSHCHATILYQNVPSISVRCPGCVQLQADQFGTSLQWCPTSLKSVWTTHARTSRWQHVHRKLHESRSPDFPSLKPNIIIVHWSISSFDRVYNFTLHLFAHS